MESQHTQGRLAVVDDFRLNDGAHVSRPHVALLRQQDAAMSPVFVGRVDAVATTGFALDSDSERLALSRADARRLAACWNACEGISTERLEKIALGLPPALRAAHQDADKLRGQLVEAMQACQEARAELNALEDRAQTLVARNYLLTAALQNLLRIAQAATSKIHAEAMDLVHKYTGTAFENDPAVVRARQLSGLCRTAIPAAMELLTTDGDSGMRAAMAKLSRALGSPVEVEGNAAQCVEAMLVEMAADRLQGGAA
jgi:hypothetical protein